MIVRPSRELRNNPARTRIARWDDRVLCGAPTVSAITPAVMPIGSCLIRRRKIARRVGWAKAAKAEIACGSENVSLELTWVAWLATASMVFRIAPAFAYPPEPQTSFIGQIRDKPERFDY